MKIYYSPLLEKYSQALGVSKLLIEETYNKPDKTDIVMCKYISIKNFNDFYILIVFEYDNEAVRFLSAYKIFPGMLNGIDVEKLSPVEILAEFMNKYGIVREVPFFGNVKFAVDKNKNVCFLGILNLEEYAKEMEKLKNQTLGSI